MANNLQKGSAGPMRLYVGSLHFNITEDMLRGIFEPFGRVSPNFFNGSLIGSWSKYNCIIIFVYWLRHVSKINIKMGESLSVRFLWHLRLRYFPWKILFEDYNATEKCMSIRINCFLKINMNDKCTVHLEQEIFFPWCFFWAEGCSYWKF